jgi:hypothetical protein
MSHKVTTVTTTAITTTKKEVRISTSPNVSASKSNQSGKLTNKNTAVPKTFEYFCRGMYRIRQAGINPKPSTTRRSVEVKKR